jgi:hypothetical protein
MDAMKNRLFVLVLVLTLLFGLTTSAAAQDNYSFQLTTEVVQVFLNQDGTMALDYVFTFANDSGAHVIDFVDVGLPNSDYDFGSISADVAGTPVSVTTDYKGDGGTGVAIDLGNKLIRQTGTVHVYVGRISRMFYPDDNDQKYASSEFSPTYFGSKFVHGKTDLTVMFHLPPGVKPEEPRYHMPKNWPGSNDPATALDNDGRVTYTWQSSNADGSTQYTFGASFPATYIPDSAIVRTTFLDLVIGAIAAFFGAISSILPFCCFGAFFFGLPIWGVINERKRKLQYIKPSISIEGHGIKRGLTAVEAAILMGQPLDKVMTMILFSAVKKGAVQVVTREPLKVEMLQPQPEGLQVYETEFIQAMVKDDRQRRKDLQAMTVNLVKSVTEKMKGFSRKETLDYYKAINDKAWQQIETAGTPEIKSQMFEEAVEWTMLDDKYDDRSRRTFTGPIFMPMWWGRYDPVYRQSSMPHTSSASGLPSMPSSSGGRVSLPGADFAASVVGGVQNFSSKVLGNVNDFTSGVTNVTNPPPPPSRSSGGGHSGGGCACACACAGCACACAGGGR